MFVQRFVNELLSFEKFLFNEELSATGSRELRGDLLIEAFHDL